MALAKQLAWPGWQKVGALTGRSPESCRTQWHACCACTSHGPWTPEEDAQLREAALKRDLRDVRAPV